MWGGGKGGIFLKVERTKAGKSRKGLAKLTNWDGTLASKEFWTINLWGTNTSNWGKNWTL